MDRKEFYEWLNTCPTHKWEVTWDSTEGEDGQPASGFIQVSFPTHEDDEAKRLEEFDRATDDAISNREDEAITFKNLMLAMEQQQAFDRDTDDAIWDRLETEGVV